jgi:hypothetical protein
MRILAAFLLLVSCTVRDDAPHILCADDSGCPPGLRCRPSGGKMLCCRDGACGTGPGSAVGGGPGTTADGDGASPIVGGSDGPLAPVDLACSSECQPGQTRCVPGGVQGCTAMMDACRRWGATIPAGPNDCAVQLIDDGLEERDLVGACAGTVCLVGGVTP